MTTDTRTGEIVRDVHVAADPDTVFDFFVDPAKVVRWMGIEADLDARPGGRFRVRFRQEDGTEPVALGEFTAIERPHRVALTWGWEGDEVTPPGFSTVEFSIEPDGSGSIVRLRHSALREAVVPNHVVGWDHFLPRLSDAVAAG